jgi:L-amino acid N-acyltransferase YncA
LSTIVYKTVYCQIHVVEVIIRNYRSGDAGQVVAVCRDSFSTLKKSQGGTHPDDKVDELIQKPDSVILDRLTSGGRLLVAEVKDTGELAGMGAVSTTAMSRILGSCYSRSHYVKKKFQGGKAGLNVGSMLRTATIEKAKSLGTRKMFGYATKDSMGFHRKSGAKFNPRFNSSYLGGVRTYYYEIALRPSIWNAIPFEPVLFQLSKLLGLSLFQKK